KDSLKLKGYLLTGYKYAMPNKKVINYPELKRLIPRCRPYLEVAFERCQIKVLFEFYTVFFQKVVHVLSELGAKPFLNRSTKTRFGAINSVTSNKTRCQAFDGFFRDPVAEFVSIRHRQGKIDHVAI